MVAIFSAELKRLLEKLWKQENSRKRRDSSETQGISPPSSEDEDDLAKLVAEEQMTISDLDAMDLDG
jgi:hypothetical protein